MHDTVTSAGVDIAYSWCRSRRRTIGITVRPDKSVAVRAPLRAPAKEIRAFVAQRGEWVVKVWKRLDARPARQLQEYARGSVFMFQGSAFRLEFAAGPHPSLHLHDGLMMLAAPEQPSEEAVRRVIDSWYRKQAIKIMTERSIECHRLMGWEGEGIPLPPITIRPMKTRWGSYSSRTGRISLNLGLIRTPPPCLDYVITHELCHIKVRHHGPDFWRMVSRYRPDYLSERLQLNLYG